MSTKDRLFAALVSCGGLGYAPVASGTFGTLAGVGWVLCSWLLRDLEGFHFGAWCLGGALGGLILGVAAGGWAEKHYGSKDPSQFVLDEFVGYCITLLRLKAGVPGWKEILVGFFLFRLFDVVKPWPARRLEFLPKGFGIMLDDVFAGIYSAMMVSMLREYLQWP